MSRKRALEMQVTCALSFIMLGCIIELSHAMIFVRSPNEIQTWANSNEHQASNNVNFKYSDQLCINFEF